MDVHNLGIKKLCLITDKNVSVSFESHCLRLVCVYCVCMQLAMLPPVKAAVDSLQASNVAYMVFDDVSIEPTNIR